MNNPWVFNFQSYQHDDAMDLLFKKSQYPLQYTVTLS